MLSMHAFLDAIWRRFDGKSINQPTNRLYSEDIAKRTVYFSQQEYPHVGSSVTDS